MAQGADVSSLGAANPQPPLGRAVLQQLQLGQADKPAFPLHLLALASQVVEAHAVFLDGGIHGRRLVVSAGKRRNRFFQRLPVDLDRLFGQNDSCSILGVGLHPQHKFRHIFFVRPRGIFAGSGGGAQQNHQQPLGHWVQGAGVTNAPEAQNAPELGHRVVGGKARLLVEQQDAVIHIPAPPGRPP